jgi:CPA2 family monovalent cation:H+ antiporter-2
LFLSLVIQYIIILECISVKAKERTGVAQRLRVSAAVSAFVVSIALSGPNAEQARRLIAPLRDLSAAMFFSFLDCRLTQPQSALPGILPAEYP